jgi:hypothetical protein
MLERAKTTLWVSVQLFLSATVYWSLLCILAYCGRKLLTMVPWVEATNT